jgi:DNA-binding NtrC family response regulator/tetratricopeptide (TPR) repeat protein
LATPSAARLHGHAPIQESAAEAFPWILSEGTEVLTEKSLLIARPVPEAAGIAGAADLELRNHLFSRPGFPWIRRAVALEQEEGPRVVMEGGRDRLLALAASRMSDDEVRAAARRLVEIVAELHARGLFLWNLSPWGLLWDREEGLAILPTSYLLPHPRLAALAERVAGSEHPLAPEILERPFPHPATDRFGAGRVLRFLLRDRDVALALEPIERLADAWLLPDPSRRPALAEALETVGGSGPASSATSIFPPAGSAADLAPEELRDSARELIDSGRGGLLLVGGEKGSGKTTALIALAAELRTLGTAPGGAAREGTGPGGAPPAAISPTPPNGGNPPAPGPRLVLLDDLDLRARVYPHLTQMLGDPGLYGDTLVVASFTTGASSSFEEEILAELRVSLGPRCREIDLAADGTSPLRALVYLPGAQPPEESASEAERALVGILRRVVADEPAALGPADVDPAVLLERLPETERYLLTFLAVYGDAIELGRLVSAFRSREEVLDGLGSLLRKGLVREREGSWTGAPDAPAAGVLRDPTEPAPLRYELAFGSLERALLSGLSPERRLALHATVADLLAEADDRSLLRFHHLLRAGRPDEAARFGLEILYRGDEGPAADSVRIQVLETLLEGDLLDRVNRRDRIQVYRDLGNHYFRRGHLDRAEECYHRGREALGSIESGEEAAELVSLMAHQASVLEKRGKYDEAREILEDALEQYGAELQIEDRAHLYYLSAWISTRLGELDRALERCNLVLRSVDPRKAPLRVADAYNLLGNIHHHRSRWTDAVSYFEKCLELRRRAGDEQKVAAALNNLGLVYRSMGETTKAIQYLEESQQIKQRMADLPGVAAGTYNIALVYLDRGELERAREWCLRAIELNRDLENRQLLAECYRALGDVARVEGELDGAEKFYQMDLEISREIGAANEQAVVLAKLARLALDRDRPDQARAMAEEAEALAEHIGSVLEKTHCALVQAEILLKEGKRSLAKEHFERAAFQFASLGKSQSAARTFARIGLLYLEENLHARAREYLEKALSHPDPNPSPEVGELEERLRSQAPELVGEIVSDSQRLQALCQMSSLVNADLERPDMQTQILEMGMRFLRADRALLAGRREGGAEFTVIAHRWGDRGISNLSAEIRRVLRSTVEQARPVAREDRPRRRGRRPRTARRRGRLSLPLNLAGRIDACIYMESDSQPFALTPKDQSFLTAFCQLAATGLEKCGLREELRSREHGLEPEEPRAEKGSKVETFPNLVGKSPAMQQVFQRIRDVRDMDTTILLLGGSGTGKEQTARAIHTSSKRRNKPFVAVNCAAIPETLLESELFGHERGAFTDAFTSRRGHFETAQGGTIFLDEIGDMPLAMQAKILRILQEKEFVRVGGSRTIRTDARVITSTNKDLFREVRSGRFREDLYYRLNVFPIRLPPLAERKEDIPALAGHFLKKYCREYNVVAKRISPEAMLYLMAYAWPGNVRELENVLRQCIILSRRERLLPEDFPEEILRPTEAGREGTNLDGLIEDIVRSCRYSPEDPLLPRVESLLALKMVEHVGEKTRAAALLGISKPTLYARIKRNG